MISLEKLKTIVAQFEEVKLVYLFGSQAKDRSMPLSDFDFAIYLKENTSEQRQKEIILSLIAKLSLALKSNNIDIVVLNKKLSPVLKYMVIKEGRLLYQKEPYKLIAEPAIYSEYFDFQVFKRVHNL